MERRPNEPNIPGLRSAGVERSLRPPMKIFAYLGTMMLAANLMAAETTAPAAKKPVTNEYQGVKVTDDYQWLENDSDPEEKAWSDAQNQNTRAFLDKLPERAAIEKQLTEWFARTSPNYSGLAARPGILF